MSTGRAAPARTSWPSLVAAALTIGGLLATYVVVVALIGADPFGATWLDLVGLALAAAVALPLWRWLHARVHELADQHHEPYAAVRAISSPGPAGTSTSASAIAAATNLPWVEVELDTVVSVGRRVDGTVVTEVPVEYGGERLGTVRVAERRPGSALTVTDRQVLSELAHELALRVVAERAVARLAESRTEIVTAREEERLRLRRDLHDGVSPSLASLQLQLTALHRRLTDDDARAAVGELLEDVRQTSADLRRLVYDLRPPLLDELGLDGALRQQLSTVAGPTLHLEVDATGLPAAVEVAVLRIVTEAVRNATRHAAATRIDVRVASTPGTVRIEVRDDGLGVPADVVPGVGLAAMRERAEELGGTLTVHAAPDGGTRVVAEIGWSR